MTPFSLDGDVRSASEVGPPPPEAIDAWGTFDTGRLVVARPARDNSLRNGFDGGAFIAAVEAALDRRSTAYDFVVLINTDGLPVQFPGAAAFHLDYSTDGVEGTGLSPFENLRVPIQAALWMNALSYWDDWGDDATDWVFAQELGHQWLAFAEYADGDERSDALLGRQSAHWSYFVDTPNSPMEGNAWIDNGDGTFTTDVEAEPAFAPVDLYMMGFIEADEVPPLHYILTDDPERDAGSSPEHLFADAPVTIAGTRVEVSLDAVIESEGIRTPGPGESQRDFRVLPVLVVGPEELVDDGALALAEARFAQFQAAWARYAGEWSTLDFTIGDDGRTLPDAPAAPSLVPRSAW